VVVAIGFLGRVVGGRTKAKKGRMRRRGFRVQELAAVGTESEDLIHFAHDGAGFTFIQFSIEVLQLPELKTSLGTGIVVFLKGEGYAGEA
jgi:hypothetical protein